MKKASDILRNAEAFMYCQEVKRPYSETSTAEIAFKTAFISFSSSELICKARGLLSSRLNIPIIDFASTTYLSNTISKSHSKAVTAFTKF